MCLQLSCAESHGGTQCTTLLCSEQQDSGATVPDRCACRLQLSWAVLISGALYPGLLTSCFDRCAYSSAGLKATGECIVPFYCAVNSKTPVAVTVRTLRKAQDSSVRRSGEWVSEHCYEWRTAQLSIENGETSGPTAQPTPVVSMYPTPAQLAH